MILDLLEQEPKGKVQGGGGAWGQRSCNGLFSSVCIVFSVGELQKYFILDFARAPNP